MVSENASPPRVSRRGAIAGVVAAASAAVVLGSASPASATSTGRTANTASALAGMAVGATADPVYLLGYLAPGDGGGGTFLWDTTAASAVDGGLVIASTVSTAGAWRRYTEDWDYINPRWFGCICDGASDDSAAFQNALRAAVRTNRRIQLPGATIRLAAAVTLPTGTGSRHVKIVGNGTQESILLLTDSGHIDLDLGDVTEYASGQLLLRDFAIHTSYIPATAFKASFNRTSGTTPQSAVIENIEVAGIDTTTGPQVGIQLVDTEALRITGVRIAGRKDKPRVAASIGLLIQGSSIPVEMYVNETKIYFMDQAIQVNGTSPHHLEGVNFDRCAVVACNYGLVATAPTSEVGLWLTVTNSTMNCSTACIVIQNWINVKIAGNLLYGDIGSASGSFDAINIYSAFPATAGSLSVITDNIIQFTGSVEYAHQGISIGGGPAEDSILISNNWIAFFTTGILLGSDSSRVAIAETNAFRSNGTDVANAGTNNVVKPALESWT